MHDLNDLCYFVQMVDVVEANGVTRFSTLKRVETTSEAERLAITYLASTRW